MIPDGSSRIGRPRGEEVGSPAVSGPIEYDVEFDGDAAPERLDEVVPLVDSIGEIPNSVRRGTEVRLGLRTVNGSRHRERAN